MCSSFDNADAANFLPRGSNRKSGDDPSAPGKDGVGTEEIADSSESNGEDARQKRFLETIYQRLAVPLLGAGVSVDRIPLSNALVPRLTRLVEGDQFPTPTTKDSLGKVAEIAIRRYGHLDTCKALGIPSWADITPTRAHR